MGGKFFFMGNSVTDRTNRITLVKLVAQRLGVGWKGYVEFYLVDGNIVIRKGEKDYDPNNGKSGFYMGSSVVDKENRTTVIKLVVQNLQINSKSIMNYFLHDDEVVLRKEIGLFDMQTKEIDVNALREEDRDIVWGVYDLLFGEFETFKKFIEKLPTKDKMAERIAEVSDIRMRGISLEKQEFVTKAAIQSFHRKTGPDGMSLEDKIVANFLRTTGIPEEKLSENLKRMKSAMEK